MPFITVSFQAQADLPHPVPGPPPRRLQAPTEAHGHLRVQSRRHQVPALCHPGRRRDEGPRAGRKHVLHDEAIEGVRDGKLKTKSLLILLSPFSNVLSLFNILVVLSRLSSC